MSRNDTMAYWAIALMATGPIVSNLQGQLNFPACAASLIGTALGLYTTTTWGKRDQA